LVHPLAHPCRRSCGRHGSVEATSFAFVVTRDRVLLGRLRRATLEGDG
jgi:hypothetical protein